MQIEEAFKLTNIIETDKEESQLSKFTEEINKLLSNKNKNPERADMIKKQVLKLLQEKMKISNELYYKLENKNQKLNNLIQIVKRMIFNLNNNEFNNNLKGGNSNLDEFFNKSK